MSVPVAHVGGIIQGPGVNSVSIGRLPAATEGTTCACGLGPTNRIVAGSRSVVIDRHAAARVGDPTSHGGSILAGCSSVIIG
jgi:uncharacterized Zn-binding protein involved in type VI secretion